MWKCRWKFVGEKCEHFFRLNVCIGFRVSSTFGQSDGCMSASRRQWADFLVSLMAPLHRQYKTARTETRCHLLLKIWQMAIQTSASRGYVLFRGANKVHTQKSAHCLLACAHSPWSAPNLERHGSSRMQTFGWLETVSYTHLDVYKRQVSYRTWIPVRKWNVPHRWNSALLQRHPGLRC